MIETYFAYPEFICSKLQIIYHFITFLKHIIIWHQPQPTHSIARGSSSRKHRKGFGWNR